MDDMTCKCSHTLDQHEILGTLNTRCRGCACRNFRRDGDSSLWGCYETGRGEVHVKPIDEEHELTECACDPRVEIIDNGAVVVVHESFVSAFLAEDDEERRK